MTTSASVSGGYLYRDERNGPGEVIEINPRRPQPAELRLMREPYGRLWIEGDTMVAALRANGQPELADMLANMLREAS